MRLLKTLLLALLMAFPGLAQVPLPQIPLTGTPGSAGNFPFLPNGTFAIPTDSDYTVLYPNTTCIVCIVTSSTSLTATRNLIEPGSASIKMTYNITNSTSGGQSIVVIGTSGSGITIANGASKWVYFNGTSYVEIDPPGGGTGLNQLTGDGTAGPGTGSQVFTLATVNSNVGACGDSTHVAQVTLNAKGLTTGCTPVAISASAIPTTPTNAILKINGANGAASSIGDDGATVSTPEPIATPLLKAPTAVSLDITNGGNGTGLENVTARTPSIAGTASISGASLGVATHGKYAFAAVGGTPSTINVYDTSTRTPTLVGSAYTVTGCNNAVDPVYDSDNASTTGAGYLYVACNASANLFVIHVSSAGALSAGASIGGITAPVVYGRPLDPVTHILYVSNFNLGSVVPVNLSSPLSPSLGTAITSTVGGTNPNMSVVAPGNGYLYAASGTDVSHQSYAQVYTTAGSLVSQVAIAHAPQGGPYMEGCYFFDAIHDGDEVAIVNACNVSAISLVGYLPLATAPLSMLVANGYAYIGTDAVNDLIIADVHNVNSPVVVATVTGYGGALGNAFNFAIAGGYLVGGTTGSNAVTYTNLGGTYTPQSFGDKAYYRTLQADQIVTDTIKNKGNITGDGYLQFEGGTPITSQSSTGSQIVTVAPGGTGTQYPGADGAWHNVGSGTGCVPSGTAGFLLMDSGTGTCSDSAVDYGHTTASTLTVPGAVAVTGATPGALSLVAGTGSIVALPANSFGFAAPVTGGTSYLIKPPATITAGIAHYAAPATNDGVLESALTSSAVSLTADVSGVLPIANGGTGAATVATHTVFGNPTGGAAAPSFTNAPVLTSVTVGNNLFNTTGINTSGNDFTFNISSANLFLGVASGATNVQIPSGNTFTLGALSGCLSADATTHAVSGSGSACGSGGGAVSSVSNSDGTLTISPTTGAVVASINLTHANNWTGVQTFTNGFVIPSGGVGTFNTGGFINANELNGTLLSGLATGLLKNTTSTGAPSIATAGTDYQVPITLTTTGTSGAATFSGGTLNIPNYAAGGGTGCVPSGSAGFILTDSGSGTCNTSSVAISNVPTLSANNTFTGIQNIQGAANSVPLSLSNITAATSGANQNSPCYATIGQYWTGTATNGDGWTLCGVLGTGSNPTTTFTFVHSGASSTGFASVAVPALVLTALGNSTSPVCPNGTNNALTTVGCAGGSSTWNGITNPTGNQSLAMGNNTTTWTFGAATGAATPMVSLTDTASNTGTGPVLKISTAASSQGFPLQLFQRGTAILTVGATGGGTGSGFAGPLWVNATSNVSFSGLYVGGGGATVVGNSVFEGSTPGAVLNPLVAANIAQTTGTGAQVSFDAQNTSFGVAQIAGITGVMTAGAGATFLKGDMAFCTSNSAACAEQMRLTSAGDLNLEFGHLTFAQTTAPVASSCGSGTVASGGTDNVFSVTGITAATACTVTFNRAIKQGVCTVTTSSTSITSSISTISTSAVTFGMALFTGTIYANCY